MAHHEENEGIIYHINPEEVMRLHPDLLGKVKQMYIFCRACNQWKKMTPENSKTVSVYEMSLKKQLYVSQHTSCLSEECLKELDEKAAALREEERFWARVEWHEKRVEEAEKRCEEGRRRRGEIRN
jgi:hypothetical protein